MSFDEELERAKEKLRKVHTVASLLLDEWFKGLDPVAFRITIIATTRDLISLMKEG